MASNGQVPTYPLKLWVDKEKNGVVVAESTGKFVNTLLTLITFPMANIIRMVSPTEIGCINNLSQSVENINADNFWNPLCKNMLLHPRNAFGYSDARLEDGWVRAWPAEYFMCSNCGCANGWLLSSFAGANCSTCGLLMNQKPKVLLDSHEKAEEDNLRKDFVKGEATYLISDDLMLMHNSPSNSTQLFLQRGYTDFNKLTEMSLNIGAKEVVDILKRSLISKSPITEVLLKNEESKPMNSSFSKLEDVKIESQNWKMKVKIITSRSKNKILYAEAEDDFIDFLFSFLTIPLASIPKLLNGNSCLGCLDNLYQGVKNMNPSWYTKHCNMMLNPGVAPQFGVKNQPLPIPEHDLPVYWCSPGGVYVVIDNNSRRGIRCGGVISRSPSLIQGPVATKLYEPRGGDDGKKREEKLGFVRRPAVFAVWDDLQMTPLTSTSTILFLKKLNVPLDDLEQHVVRIGETEALQLLRASLTSGAALTEGLLFLLKKPVPEEQIPPCLEAPIESETTRFCLLKKYISAVYYMLFYSVVLNVKTWLRKGRD